MKTTTISMIGKLMVILLIGISPLGANAQDEIVPLDKFTEYKGKIVDGNRGNEIPSAHISVVGTYISTVTNTEGKFSLKVPNGMENGVVTISHLGYKSKSLPLEFFEIENAELGLEEAPQELTEINLVTAANATQLVKQMLEKKGDNYLNQNSEMKAFYREAIKKGSKNVSLSEAVVTIHKQPYTSWASDNISVIKARKSVDYEKLDTIALKLRGGPFNTLNIDLIKNSDYIFNAGQLDNFIFEFDEPSFINDQYVYVVNFEEKAKNNPWYYGKLYIDANSSTLVKASFNLNVDDKTSAAAIFVKKKPGGTKVYPIDVHYDIEYRKKDGKWYFGYGKTEVLFVVNWKRKLFNSRYKVNGEMVVTDWKKAERVVENTKFLSPSVIMVNDVSGFADTSFWGNDNIIEPDKSIENAIHKIQKGLR